MNKELRIDTENIPSQEALERFVRQIIKSYEKLYKIKEINVRNECQ